MSSYYINQTINNQYLCGAKNENHFLRLSLHIRHPLTNCLGYLIGKM